MLPKRYRLSLKKEFKQIKKQAQIYYSRSFSLLVIRSSGLSKFAFIVSKKIDKRAVKRNQVKRRLAAGVQAFLPKIKSGFKIIFLAKKNILNLTPAELTKEIKSALQKIKILA